MCRAAHFTTLSLCSVCNCTKDRLSQPCHSSFRSGPGKFFLLRKQLVSGCPRARQHTVAALHICVMHTVTQSKPVSTACLPYSRPIPSSKNLFPANNSFWGGLRCAERFNLTHRAFAICKMDRTQPLAILVITGVRHKNIFSWKQLDPDAMKYQDGHLTGRGASTVCENASN